MDIRKKLKAMAKQRENAENEYIENSIKRLYAEERAKAEEEARRKKRAEAEAEEAKKAAEKEAGKAAEQESQNVETEQAERAADKLAQEKPKRENRPWEKNWADYTNVEKREGTNRPAFKDFRSTETQWDGSPFRAELLPSRLGAHFAARKQLLDLANEEVEKYYGDQLRELKEAVDFYQRNGLGESADTTTSTGLRVPNTNPQYQSAVQKYEDTKRKALELKNLILTAGNADVYAAGALANLGLDSDVIKLQAAASKEAISAYKTFKDNGGKYYEQEANALGVHAYDATNEYNKSLNELNRLASYMSTMGMPDDIEQLPKDVKQALFKYAPQLANVEEYRDFVQQFRLNDDLLSTLAGEMYEQQKAKASGIRNSISSLYALQELLNQELWNDILKSVQHPGGDIDYSELAFNAMRQEGNMLLSPVLTPKEQREGLAKELAANSLAIDLLKRAQRYKEVSDWLKTTQAPKWAAELGVGAVDFVRNAEDWATAGLVPLAESLNTLDIANKVNSGKPLNKSERDLLTALAIEQEMNDRYGDYKNDAAYIISNSALESVPYMVEFVLTSGIASALEGAGKYAANKLTKLALSRAEKFGIDVAKKDLLRTAITWSNRFGRGLGDVAYANFLTNTIQGAKTAREVIDLHTGSVDYNISDVEGQPILINGFKDQVDWGNAIYTIEGQRFAENMSEMFGEYSIMSRLRNKIPIPKEVANSKFVSNVKKLYDRANGTNLWKGLDDFAHAAKWNGIAGEWYEELVGTAMRHAMGVDDSGKNVFEDLFDAEQQLETLGSLTLSMFTMGLTGAGGYLYHNNRLNRAKANAKKQLGDKWDSIQRAIVTADDSNVDYVTNQIINTLGNQEDRKAVLNYHNKLMAFRGASILDQTAMQQHRDTRIARMAEQAKRDGYFETYNERRRNLLEQDLENAKHIAELNVATLFNVSTDELANNHSEILTFVLNTIDNEDATPQAKEQAAAYLTYMNLNSALDGLHQRKWDDINIKKQEVVDNVRWYLSNENLLIVTAKFGDDLVAIVRGDVTNDDAVTVYNMSKGRFEKVESRDINKDSVNEPLDAVYYIIGMQQRIEQDYQDAEKANAVRSGLEVGSSYLFADGRELTVLGAARDGGFLYSIHEDGKEDIVQHAPAGDLKSLIDNINNERVSTIVKNALENVKTSLAANPIDFTRFQEENEELQGKLVYPVTATSYKKIGQVKETGNETKDKAAHLNNAAKVLQMAELSETVADFATNLYQNKLYFEDEQANAVWKAFKAFKAGNLTKSQFTNIFVPERYRSEDVQKSLDDIDIDWDGTVTHPKQIKARQEQEAEELQTQLNSRLQELNSTIDIEDLQQLKRDLEDSLPDGFKLKKRGGVWLIVDTNKVSQDSPVKPTPENQGTVGEVGQTNSNLLKVVDAIYDKIRADNQNVLIEQRTAHDYFIIVDGKRRMHSRVHSALGSQKEEPAVVEKLMQQHINDLRDAYNQGIAQFRIAAKRLTSGLVDIKDYLSYIEETPEDAELVFEAIAYLAEHTNKPILKPEYKGKLIYVLDGGGKSTIKKYNPDVVDADDLLKELAPDGFDRVPQEKRGEVMTKYNAKIRAAHKAGKTVLTANIQMLSEADVIIYNNSVTDTTNRTNAEDRDRKFKAPARAKQHLDEINKLLAQNTGVEAHKLSPGLYAADILTQRTVVPALEIGSEMDDVYRALFAKEDVSYVGFRLSNGKRVSDIMSEDTFNSLKSAVAELKKAYKGWTLITEPVRVYGEFFDTKTNRVVRVCGETDMLGVDENGIVHIIDFKTSKYEFGKGFETKLRGYRVSTKEYYLQQLTMYMMLAKLQFNVLAIALLILPTTLKYNQDLYIESATLRVPIQLNHNDSLLSRFISKSDVGELKNIVGDYFDVIDDELSVPTENIPVDAATWNYVQQFEQRVESWKEKYESAEIFEDYIWLINEYEKLMATHQQLFLMIEEDEEAALKDELNYLLDPLNQKPEPITELEIEESQHSAEELNDANIAAQFEQNRNELSGICLLIQLNHWNEDPTQVPESVRQRIDLLIANMDALLQTGKPQITLSIIEDYERAKRWLDHTLNVDGTSSTPQVPEEVTDDNFKKYTTLRLSEVAASVATDDPNLKLSDVANKPDFAKKALFVLSQKKKPGKSNPNLYVSVVYEGHTYTPIEVYTAHNKAGKDFYHFALGQLRAAQPGQIVVANVAQRTRGDIKLQNNSVSLIDKGFVTSKKGTLVPNIYDIEFTGNQQLFGVVRDGKNGHAVVSMPKKDGSSWNTVYIYPNAPGVDNTPTAGTIVYMASLNYDEYGKPTKFPVFINSPKLGEKNAQFIVDILSGEFVIDKNMSAHQVMNSKFILDGDTGLTCAQVMSYLIPYGNADAIGHNFVYLELDRNNGHIVHIKGRVDGSPASISEIPDHTFDISTDDGKEKLKTFLANNVNMHIDLKGFARGRLGSNQTIKNLLATRDRILFGNSSIVFEKSDLKDPDNQTDKAGLSGLGWYVKNGFLNTRYDGLEAPWISFDERAGVSKLNEGETKTTKIESVGTAEKPELPEIEIPEESVSYLDIFGGTDKTVRRTHNDINEKDARANLERIFGKNGVRIEFFDKVLSMTRKGWAVVARCEYDAILLTKLAGRGDEYHEAFHRVVDLFLTKKQREKLFAEYRRVKNNPDMPEKQVREGLCDEFQYYAMNTPTFKLTWNFWNLFKTIRDWVRMLRDIGSWRLFKLYTLANNGYFAHVVPSQEQLKHFAEITPLYLLVRNAKLKHVATEYQYKELINSIAFMFLKPEIKAEGWFNVDVTDIKVNKDTLINNPYVKALLENEETPQNIKDVLQEAIDNFEDIVPDVVAYLNQFTTDYKQVFDDANVLDKEGAGDNSNTDEDYDPTSDEEIANAQMDLYTKSSYEFHPFTRISQRVKWFFAGIPLLVWLSKDKAVTVPNSLGLPQLMNPKEVYANVLNALHNIKSPQDFLDQCEKLAETDPMYAVIYNRFKPVFDGSIDDADKEGFVTQMWTAIKLNKNDFDTVLARQLQEGHFYTFSIVSQDKEHLSRQYKENWASNFLYGGCRFATTDDRGQLVMAKRADGKTWPVTVFNSLWARVASFDKPYGYAYLFSAVEDKQPVVINGRVLDVDSPEDIQFVKDNLIEIFNSIGISFTGEMLNRMLLNRYGDIGKAGLSEFFSDSKLGLVDFFKRLNGIYSVTTNTITATTLDIRNIFNNSAFTKELANQKYQYEHEKDQLMVLAVGGNRFYTMSENNLITDRLEELTDPEYLQLLAQYEYNLVQEGEVQVGSIMMKHAMAGGQPLRFHTLVGFKSNSRGDQGIDYSEISSREDYISKAAILANGHILLPTMSDKKTFGYIAGLTLPGLIYKGKRVQCTTGNINNKLILIGGVGIEALVDDEVVDQLIEYAACEHKAIRTFLDNAPQHDVKNFNKGQQVTDVTGTTYTILQGGRYNFLLGVYEGSEYVEFNTIFDENGNYTSEEQLYNKAQEHFFDKDINEQRNMIRRMLTEATKKELKSLEDLGLIRRVEGVNDPMLAYENVGLDQLAISAIGDALIEGMDQSKMRIEDFDNIRRRAVSTYVSDIVAKHIMSMQECTRVFSGNPAFFEHKYDEKGHLVDITTDMQKRLGGLVSTGQNNNTFLPNIPKKYTCAEILDKKIVSKDIEEFREKIYECELRYAYHQYLLKLADATFDSNPETLKLIADTVYETKKEEIETALGETALSVIKLKAAQKTDALSNVNVADGASYVSDKMCENLLREVGAWNKEIQEAFKILRGEPANGKTYTTKEILSQTEAYQKVLTTVIGTQKYTAYGYRFQDGVCVPYYNKTALFPLFKCIASGKMAVIYDAMQKQGVDMVMMSSAVKVGGQEAQKFDDIVNGTPFSVYQQEYKYLRKQFNTDPKEKDMMSMGTQMTKVALQSLMPGLTYKVGEKEYTATEIRDNIMRCMKDLSEIGAKEIEDRFFTGGKLDVDKFSKLLTEELANRGANREQLAAVLAITEDDGSVNLRIPLDAQSSSNWILSIVNSIINKAIIDTNTEGKAFYQRSVLGMEGGKILDDANMAPSINNENRLKVKNENGSMDCVLSIDFFSGVLKRAGLENASFDEQKQWLIDNGIISGIKSGETEWSGASANLIGYRIPTQATSSIHALRCVDVLPVVRDTVILPAEFTAITGSDFDIDKIFISALQYDIKERSDFATEEKYGITTTDFTRLGKTKKIATDFEEGSVEYLRNELVRNYLAILCATDNAMHLLNGSIDKDTKLLTDIRDLLESKKPKSTLNPFDPFTLSSLSKAKLDFIMGKFGIGPFALNNNSHILTMLYGVEFADKTNGILTRLGKTSLHEMVDDDGNSIMSWLSGLINAHVDVAKDPYIGRLGVNTYTYNLVNLLIRTGFGKKTFFFTTQPIMQQFATAYQIASGVYMQDKTISKSKRQKAEIEKVWLKALSDKYSYQYKTLRHARKAFSELFMINHGVDIDDAIDALMDSKNDILLKVSVSGISSIFDESTWSFKINGKDVSLTTFEIQMLVAEANDQFSDYSQQLSDLVKYSKIDTKKQGKTITQQRMYEEGFKKIFSSKAFKNNGLSRLRYGSYIDAKTEKALLSFRKVFDTQLIESKDEFWEDTETILSIIGKKGIQDERVVKDVMNAIKAKIKSGYFFGRNGYCERYGIDPKSLVSGNNTLYDRLQKLLAKILSDPAYKEYREKGGVPKNYLLKNLVSSNVWEAPINEKDPNTGKRVLGEGTFGDAYGNAKFVSPLNFLSDDPVEQDLFTLGWYELLNDNGFPEGQEFARDLIVYAFMTSGANGGRFDLFKYVPNEWKENIDGDFDDSYVAYMQRQLDNYTGLSNSDIDDIILNNWHNDNFIPTYDMLDADGHPNFTTIVTDQQNGYPIVMAAVSMSEKLDYVKMRLGKDPIPQYIKIQRTQNTVIGQRNYVVYRLAGMYSAARGYKGQLITFPVYTAVDPKGVKYPSGDTIYEYGWEASTQNEAANAVLKVLGDFITKHNLTSQPYMDMVLSGTTNLVSTVLDFIRQHQDVEDRYKLLEIDPLLKYLAGSLREEDSPSAEEFEEMEDIEEEISNFDKSTAKFYSGAAEGSDKEWGLQARALGINVKDYTVQDWDELSQELKDKYEKEYIEVVQYIGRNVMPSNTYKGKLVRRDMMQADNADAIFAIAERIISPTDVEVVNGIEYPNNTGHDNVAGGTGYAVGRAILRGRPVYVFDLSVGVWKEWDSSQNMFVQTDLPTLTQHAAVIGTRNIDESGKRAIASVLNRTINGTVNPAPNTYTPGTQLQSGTSNQVPASYEGMITPDANTIFVFGSNPEGRHGAGAAKTAREKFGAVYGQGEGLQGNAYALPTKDLRVTENRGLKSISPEQITENIRKMYEVARQNPNKLFKVAYTHDLNATSLNGYTGAEMIKMFKDAGPIPSNVVFSKNWTDHWNEVQSTQQHDDNQLVLDVKDTVDVRSVDATILTIEGKKDEFSKEERQSIKSILGDTRPKVLVASEHTDPVWHAKAIKLMVEEELKKPAKDRKFHMMYLITKHDGLPLRELAELKIPKFVHFSITSLGGTKYEPGVMKMDDMLDRIQEFIKEGVLNPNLVTIRIDPIIPGVTTNEDIEHIVQRATAMGIKQFKFSIMDSYGYTATGQRSNNNRYIIPKMEQLGYNWDEYYGKNAAGIVNFDAKPQYMEQIYTFMDGLAQKYNIWFNTCGERPANIPNLTKIRWSMGCVNVLSMNAAMGTTDIANTQGNQRPGCTCYGNIVDALEYSDKCASSCVYCYAKHNSDAAVLYYNEDGTLKDNRFTRTSNLSFEADQFEHFVEDNSTWDNPDEFPSDEMNHCKGD